MTNMTKYILVSILLGVVFIGIAEWQTHYGARLYDELILGEKNHYLSCDELPTVQKVDKAVKEHADVVNKIVKVVGERNRGPIVTPQWKDSMVVDGSQPYITFAWGELYPVCEGSGKGDIVMYFSSDIDKMLIERILKSDTFFGIPYRLRNT